MIVKVAIPKKLQMIYVQGQRGLVRHTLGRPLLFYLGGRTKKARPNGVFGAEPSNPSVPKAAKQTEADQEWGARQRWKMMLRLGEASDALNIQWKNVFPSRAIRLAAPIIQKPKKSANASVT